MFKVADLKSCLLAIAPLIAIALAFPTLCAFGQSISSPKGIDGVDWSKAERMTVIMGDYEFMPDRLTFRQGIPARLHLVNRSGSIHDFTAPHFLKTVDLRDPGVIGASGTGIPVEPHQQKDVDLVPRLRGHFELICADHDWAGMTANIFVE